MIKRDELSGWLGSMEQYTSKGGSQAVRGFWIESFDGGYKLDLRVGRGRIHIDNLSTSIIGGMQPKKMAEFGLLKLTSDGLLQRYIPTMMTPTGLAIDKPCDTEAYDKLVRELITATDPVGPWGHFAAGRNTKPLGLQTREITFDDAALKIMNDLRVYLHQLEHNAGGVADGFSNFIGKLPGLSGSLALILHMAADPKAGIGKQVSENTAKDVHHLVMDFIIPHAYVFYRSAESDINGDRIRKLASWIITTNMERFVASDLTVNVRDFRGLTLQEVNERVSPLVAANWIKPEDNGPLHKAWEVNQAIYEQFEERAKQEEAEKAALAKLMNSPKKGRKV